MLQAHLLFVKSVCFIVVRHELRTYDTSKVDFFANIIYSLKLLTNLTKTSILRTIKGHWICLGYIFRFSFSLDLFISPNIFKLIGRQLCTQMSIQGIY